MRILFLNHNVAWVGGFFRAYHWGRYLRKKGHSVTIITISEHEKVRFSVVQKDGVTIIKGPDLLSGNLRSGWDPWDVLARVWYIKNKEFDIIHCVDTRPNVVLPALFLRWKSGGRLVMDWGDWWGRGGTIRERSGSIIERLFEPVETFFEEYFRKYADGSVVLTEALRVRALKLGVREDTVARIPHGADIENIKSRDKNTARDRLRINRDEKVLGYIGAIFPEDANLLCSAYKLVFERIDNVKLLIIGNCKFEFPVDLVRQKKLVKTGKIDFDRLLDYLAVCDVMLLPLRRTIANNGRWPSKVCDYLAAGKPVVSTNVSDVSQLFKDNLGGYVTEDNPEDFADGIIKMLGQNEHNMQVHANAARQIAEKEISWQTLTDKLEVFYRKILDQDI